jgi:hypothetical protein
MNDSEVEMVVIDWKSLRQMRPIHSDDVRLS